MQPIATITTEQQVTFPVRLRGRSYPQSVVADPQTEQAPKTQVEPNPVRDQLSKLIKDRLPFLSDELPDTTAALTEVYIHSLQTLERFRQDVDNLIPYLCEANLFFRHESETESRRARQEAITETLNAMIAKTTLDIRPPKNIVDAKLLALPAQPMVKLLRDSLEGNVELFVSQFFNGLDRLVDNQIAGLVEWTSQTTCCYYFFREVIVQQVSSSTRASRGRRESKNSPTGWVENIETTLRGIHTHRLARHEHHTTDAFQTSIADSQVVMPEAVAKFVANIPEWLAPVVRVIDGKLRRERIIERDIKKEKWSQRDVQDVPVAGCEPAVVIDHIVLTGWGPRDIDAELARRDQEARARAHRAEQNRASTLAPICWTIGVCLSILCLWLCWRLSYAGLTVAFFAQLLAIPCWIRGLVSSAKATNRPLDKNRPLLVSLGITSIVSSLALFVSFGFSSGLIIGTSLVLLTSGISLVVPRPRRRRAF